MENLSYVEKLEELLKNEDILAVSAEVNELRVKFNDYELEEERKQQVAQIQAQEKGEDLPESTDDFGKEAFYAQYNAFKEKRKAIIDEKKATEELNLKTKKDLIKKLQDVITNEENIGAAFSSFKEVQEKWKEVGDIPRDKRSEVQSEYSKLIEDFFYNIKIYKELKDHDFHRNKQLKEAIIAKLKTIKEVESFKEVEHQLKTLQNDWEDIGPVPNEDWELLKDAYWTEVRSIYERINRYYEDRREVQKENIRLKQELIATSTNIVEGIDELDSVKDWDKKTKEIIEIQNKWKTIGYGPKKENEEVWKTFRGICDRFFEAKKGFFGQVNEKFDAIAEKKMALIDQAEKLKTSTDWKETANKIIQLQQQWKKLGHSGKKNEQKLWRKFRSSCDDFFNARQKHFADQDAAFESNLTEKEAVIAEINALKLPDNKSEALTILRDLSAKFNAIGRVPMKAKDKTFKAFKDGMDKHYSALKLEGQEKADIMFKAKLETLKASPNAGRSFDSLRIDLRKDIDKLKKEVILLENNLGFFANSKGADALKKDVEKKINKANSQIEGIKAKLKLIPNE